MVTIFYHWGGQIFWQAREKSLPPPIDNQRFIVNGWSSVVHTFILAKSKKKHAGSAKRIFPEKTSGGTAGEYIE